MKPIIDALRMLDKHDLLDSDEASKLCAILLSEPEHNWGKISTTLRAYLNRELALKTARDVMREYYKKGFNVTGT